MARNNSRCRRYNPVMRNVEAQSKGSRTVADITRQTDIERQLMAPSTEPSTMFDLYNELRAKGINVVIIKI